MPRLGQRLGVTGGKAWGPPPAGRRPARKGEKGLTPRLLLGRTLSCPPCRELARSLRGRAPDATAARCAGASASACAALSPLDQLLQPLERLVGLVPGRRRESPADHPADRPAREVVLVGVVEARAAVAVRRE